MTINMKEDRWELNIVNKNSVTTSSPFVLDLQIATRSGLEARKFEFFNKL